MGVSHLTEKLVRATLLNSCKSADQRKESVALIITSLKKTMKLLSTRTGRGKWENAWKLLLFSSVLVWSVLFQQEIRNTMLWAVSFLKPTFLESAQQVTLFTQFKLLLKKSDYVKRYLSESWERFLSYFKHLIVLSFGRFSAFPSRGNKTKVHWDGWKDTKYK